MIGRESGSGESVGGVNPLYADHQLAKAQTASEGHADEATRERAKVRVAQWQAVLENIRSGLVGYGSRTPLQDVPAWVTLEVVTGGFATGQYVASGPLRPHEEALVLKLPQVESGCERAALNRHFLYGQGLLSLGERLRHGHYDIEVPEEGALLVVAWLVEHGFDEAAYELEKELHPFLATLRFYPIPLAQPRTLGSRVHLQDVESTIKDLRKIKPNQRLLAQKEAVDVWAPYYDRVITLFLETLEPGKSSSRFSPGWADRATELVKEFDTLRKRHCLCSKPERAKGHFAQLRMLLEKAAKAQESFADKDWKRLQNIIDKYVQKRGRPGSEKHLQARSRQRSDVRGPTFCDVAQVVITRLESYEQREGIDEASTLGQVVTDQEAAGNEQLRGAHIPDTVQRKVERCFNETVAVLIERDLITSGETLARVLPQITAGIRSAGIADPALRQLYAAIYRAFRRRRSLLLLNLETQVQIEELPWVAAIDRFRSESLTEHESARQTLEEVALLTITSFPHAIVPNKLLQELRALIKTAKLDLPLVDEVAADIFMGTFSDKFLHAAKIAAEIMRGTLYARYFGIDYDEITRMPDIQAARKSKSFWHRAREQPDHFVQLCASRAGVPLGTWSPATNGMIIEQQQILTTQNLAGLFARLDLTRSVGSQLGDMAKQCFIWICKRQQMRTDNWHGRLIMVKNTAYAWRQMVFFLALLPAERITEFLSWAEDHLDAQSASFKQRFAPALKGLQIAAEGNSTGKDSLTAAGARQFLGWSNSTHWLLG